MSYEEIKSYNHIIDELQKENTKIKDNEYYKNKVNKLQELVSDLLFCRQHNCLTCSHGRICDLRIEERAYELGVRTD